jgi:aspartyl-tRNA(Asn)/glutamyl-tRNA(Gln) amidotransferase subunit A
VVGVTPDLHPAGADTPRLAVLERMTAAAVEAGAEVREIGVPEAREAFEVMGTMILVEGLATHRRHGLWPHRAADYGADVRARLELAEDVTFTEHLHALQRAKVLRDALARVFTDVDVLLSLTSGVGPIRRDQPGSDPAFRRAVMSCTAVPSVCGLPACAVPAGVDARGLPVGVQVTGRPGADRQVLRITRSLYERRGT